MNNASEQTIALGDADYSNSWLLGSDEGQVQLAKFHNADARPRCLCTHAGVEMYVAKRGERFYLARMPLTGMFHAASCKSNEDTNLYSGGEYSPLAIMESSDGVDVTVDFGVPTSRNIRTTVGDGTQQRLVRQSLSLDGLLDFLLESADLNVWRPGETARTWEVIRQRLLEATAKIKIRQQGMLADCLIVPEPYDQERYDNVWSSHDRVMRSQRNPLVFGVVKSIQPTKFGYRISIKHMPRSTFWLGSTTAKRYEDLRDGLFKFDSELSKTICLLLVKSQPEGPGYQIVSCSFKRVDRRCMPVFCKEEAEAGNEFEASGYAFMRPLRFDLSLDRPLADFVLVKEGQERVPVFVSCVTGSKQLDESRSYLSSLMKRHQSNAVFYSRAT